MKIEIATVADVPELLNLQLKAFGPVAESLNWTDAPIFSETEAYAREEFQKYTTLKMVADGGKIIGSVRGCVKDGSLYIGRLMVLPEFQKHGYGRVLLREIQSALPHDRAWLETCGEISETVSFYEREGFRPFKTEYVAKGISWIFTEK